MEPSLYSLFVIYKGYYPKVEFFGTFSSELFALDGFKHEFIKELKESIEHNIKLLDEDLSSIDDDLDIVQLMIENDTMSEIIKRIETCDQAIENYNEIINDKDFLYYKCKNDYDNIEIFILEHRFNETFNQRFW